MADASKMPVAFFGHGTPMNALADNRYTRGWRAMAQDMPRPRAILAVSAHWFTQGTAVTINAPKQRTIHDFYGFPKALFDIDYAAPGDPQLAERVRTLLAPVEVHPDDSWGLDHGSWSVLLHAWPEADIPVVQLSLDGTQPASFHLELARRLAPLREEGVLVAGFGNVVHNLRLMRRDDAAAAYDWAGRFNERIREALVAGDDETLVHWERQGEDARLSVPTPEHYLPLLYLAGLRERAEPVSIPIDGIENGSLSMLSAVAGNRAG